MSINTGLSGYFDLPANKAGVTVRVYWVETYDIENNTSTFSISNIQAKSSDWYGVSYFLDGQIALDGISIIDFDKSTYDYYFYWGKLNEFADVRVQNEGVLPPWTYSGVEHNEDGSKTVSISVNISGHTISGGAGNGWEINDVITIKLIDIPVVRPEPEPIKPIITFFYDGEQVLFPRYEKTVVGFIIIPPVLGTQKTVTGTTIRVDDVMKTGQPLQIQTTAGAEVSVYGKNLLDINAIGSLGVDSYVTNNGDGTLSVNCNKSRPVSIAETLGMVASSLKVGETYVLSATTTDTAKYLYLNPAKQTWRFGSSLTITQEMLNSKLMFYATLGTIATVSNLQIEHGSSATPYEDYKTPQTATADADGKVSGLTSVAPTMTVVSDEVVECTYIAKD